MAEATPPVAAGRALLAALPGIVVAAILYLPGRNGFFLGEDLINLTKARHSTAAALFAPSTTTFLNPHYRPLWHLTYRGLDAAFGLDPTPFHLASLALHLLAVALAAQLARRLGLGTAAIGAAAAWMALHPASSQPVLWISSLNVVLGAVFALLALERALAWLDTAARSDARPARKRERGRAGEGAEDGGAAAKARKRCRGNLLLAAAALLAALATQEFAYSLPVVFLLAAVLLRPAGSRLPWRAAFGAAGVGLALAASHFFFLEKGLQDRLAGDVGGGGISSLLPQAAGYLGQDLSFVWGAGWIDLTAHPLLAGLLAMAVVVGLLLRRGRRTVAFVAWCVAAPFPSVLADAAWRHVYLAIVPASIALALAAEGLAQAAAQASTRVLRHRPSPRASAVLVVTCGLTAGIGMAMRIPAEVAAWNDLGREGEDAFHAVEGLLAGLPEDAPAPVLVNLPACHRGILLHFTGPEGERRFGALQFLETNRFLYAGARLQDCVRQLEAEGREVYLFRGDRFLRLRGDEPVSDRELLPEAFLAREIREARDGRAALREVLASKASPLDIVWVEGMGGGPSEPVAGTPASSSGAPASPAGAIPPAGGVLEKREAGGGCAGPAPQGTWFRRYRVRSPGGTVLVVLNPYLPVLDPLGLRLDPGGPLRRPYLGLLRATVDGNPRPLHRAQAFFSALAVEAGTHEVEVRWGP